MAKCDLSIEIEENPRPTLGGTVRGVVRVEVDGEVECRGLRVRTMWATHGKGNRATGGENGETLFQGVWREGQPTTYPFEIPLCETGPAPYAGRYLNVDWFVHATADIPWKIDPHAEVRVPVRRDVVPDEVWREQYSKGFAVPKALMKEALEEGAKNVTPAGKLVGWVLGGGCLLFVLAILLGTLGGAGAALWHALLEVRSVIDGERGWTDVLGSLVLLAIAAAVVLAIVVGISRVVLRKQRLGEVALELDPAVVDPGEDVRVVLRGQPARTLQLNRATARLRAQEIVVRGSGTNKTTYRHDLVDETVEIGLGRPLRAGMPYEVEGTVRVPDDAPASFSASSNTLKWTVEVAMDVAACPDWSGSEVLVVAPTRAWEAAG